MMKCSVFLPIVFLCCNLQAVWFTSIRDGQAKELPDSILIKNDLDVEVRIEGKMFIMDGCAPIDPISLPPKKDHCLNGLDASGLYLLGVTHISKKYGMNFPGESYLKKLDCPHTYELIVKVSEIIDASIHKKESVDFEQIRRPKK
ncbi:hypothetical protein BH09DEP1_BH09DEP1_0840 [soil metagenome]